MTGIDMIQTNRSLSRARASSEAARRDDTSIGFKQMLKDKDQPAETKDLKQSQDKDAPAEKTDSEKTGSGKTESGKTESGKTESGKTDTEKTGKPLKPGGEEGQEKALDLLLAAAMMKLQAGADQTGAVNTQSSEAPAESSQAAEGGEAAGMTGIAAAMEETGTQALGTAGRDGGMAAGPLMETDQAGKEPAVAAAQTEDEAGQGGISTAAQSSRNTAQGADGGIQAAADRGHEQKSASGEEKSSENNGQGHAGDAISQGVTGQPENHAAAGQAQFRTMTADQPVTDTLKTTPDTLPQDLGQALAARLPGTSGTLTIELEPASLGKLTIQVIYEEGKAAVSIMSANPKTLELLSRSAPELAGILEEKTGQQTVIYTQQPEQQQSYDEGRDGGRQQDQDRREEKREQPSDSFAQQLRLGLV